MKKTAVVFLTAMSSFAFSQGLDKEAIRSNISEHSNEVRACYENRLQQNPDLRGKIVVDFEVNDKGHVQNAKINTEKSSLNDEKVYSCVTRRLKTWKFPAAQKGQITNISYPFIFGTRPNELLFEAQDQ